MRITCPSCASEYEVDVAAIGARGRMVRCANCEAEWFQAPLAGEAAAAPPPPPAPSVAPPLPPDPAPEPEVVVSETPEFDPSPPTYPDPEPVVQEQQDLYAAPPPPSGRSTADAERIYYDVEPATEPRLDDPNVVEETRVRRRKDTGREDLAASLRELDEDHPSSTGGAFLAGFSTVAVMAVIAVAIYVKAPDIAKLAPAMEGPLSGYTELVNQGRFALAEATQ